MTPKERQTLLKAAAVLRKHRPDIDRDLSDKAILSRERSALTTASPVGKIDLPTKPEHKKPAPPEHPKPAPPEHQKPVRKTVSNIGSELKNIFDVVKGNARE